MTTASPLFNLSSSDDGDAWDEVAFQKSIRLRFKLAWEEIRDPIVLLDDINVTNRCAWIRLDPGGMATAGLYVVDSSGHRIMEKDVVLEEIRGRYEVKGVRDVEDSIRDQEVKSQAIQEGS